jgi:hypothetical protein
MMRSRRLPRRISGENRPSNIQLIQDSERYEPVSAKNTKHMCSGEPNLESARILARKVRRCTYSEKENELSAPFPTSKIVEVHMSWQIE